MDYDPVAKYMDINYSSETGMEVKMPFTYNGDGKNNLVADAKKGSSEPPMSEGKEMSNVF